MKLPANENRLSRSFYDRSPRTVARDLLGRALLRRINGQWLGGWIVETEAYLSSGDPASHSARGKTAGNSSMFGPPGTLYVYPIHAKYCMNAVTQKEGVGSAVLIRAIQPAWGLGEMAANRGTEDLRRLTRGPAMLCQAIQVNQSADNVDLLESTEIMITEVRCPVKRIKSTSRIGISSATDLKLRFFIDGNWFVSGRVSDHTTRPLRPTTDES